MMPNTELIQSGGLQFIPEISEQIVYLDFDGEQAVYNGELLMIDDVKVEASGLAAERIAAIVARLNAEYAGRGVTFVTERPVSGEHSTVYIGKTSAFAPYGNFSGVAETIDSGNKIKNDNAFVNLNAANSDAEVVAVISHEVDHIVFGMNHDGTGMERYAYTYYYNQTYTGVLSSSLTLWHCTSDYDTSGGATPVYYYYDKAQNVIINSWRELSVSSGGSANGVTINSEGGMSVSSGGRANGVTINSGGRMNVSSGGRANDVIINSGGTMWVSSDGNTNGVIANGGAIGNGGNMTLGDGAVFTGNVVAWGWGGAINNGGSMTLGDGAVFSGNVVSSGWGGAINNGNSGNITLGDGAVFNDNAAHCSIAVDGGIISGGGGAIYNGGSMTLGNGAVFTGNVAGIYGGAIYNSGSLTLGDGAVFSGNSRGAIYNNGGSLTLGDGAVFTGNIGYAIYNYGGMTLGDDAVFTGNSRGAINNSGGSLTLGDGAVFTGNIDDAIYNYGSMTLGDGAVFSGNSGLQDCGAIGNGGNMTLGDGAVFTDNVALTGNRGAINNSGGSMTLGDGAVFTGNIGGAIDNWISGSITLGDGTVFSGNVISSYGGGAIDNGGNMTLGDGAVFTDNVALWGGGGAITNGGGSMTLGNDAVFSGNTGGAIGNGGSMTLGDGAVFTDNATVTNGYGGAIGNGGSMTLGDGAVFTDNVVSSGNGGAIYNGGSMTLGDGAVFTDNVVSSGNGGAIDNWNSGSLTLNSATFTGNIANGNGGAICNYNSGSITLNSATFTGNVANGNGGAICNGEYWNGGMMALSDCKFETHTDTIYNMGDITIDGTVSFAGNVVLANSYIGGILTNNGTIDLNIAPRYEDDGILINNWSRISGDGDYTLTVSTKQVAGDYRLIGNAAEFDKTITVRGENGFRWGELSLDMKRPLEYRDIGLMLVLDEKTNVLTVQVNSEYSKGTAREKQETQIELPETAFPGFTAPAYELKEAPEWLSIDPATGKFSGTTGKITDTETGYGTTEVVITATEGEAVKEHTIDVVVVPENIKGDGKIDGKSGANMTDVVAQAVRDREKHAEIEIEYDNVDWEYEGLEVSLTDLSAALTVYDDSYELKLQAQMHLAIFNSSTGGDEKPSLTVDLAGGNYLKITTPHDFESMKVDVVGELKYQNLTLSDAFFLQEGVIKVDTENDHWYGSAEIDFTYFDKTLTGEYEVVRKKVNTITVELSGLNVAVGTTGFFLNTIHGGVKNLADSKKHTELNGGMTFTYGKEVSIGAGTFSLAKLDLDCIATKVGVTGSGTITVLGEILTGTISAEFNWNPGYFQGSGALTLANLCTISSSIKIDKQGSFMVKGSSSIDFSKYGLAFSAASTVMLQYSFDGNNSNDFYAAWFTQKVFENEYKLGVKFALDGSWELLNADMIKKLSGEAKATANGISLRNNAPVTQSWDLSGVTGVVFLSATWSEGNAVITLSDSSGNVYTVDEVRQQSNIAVVDELCNENTIVIALNDPSAGVWSLSAVNASDIQMSANTFNSSATTTAPTISVSEVTDRAVTLTWNADTLPDNAEISIYYDSDAGEYDGLLVTTITAAENTGTYEWTVPETIAGALRFYAVAAAPDALPALGSYSSSVEIDAVEQTVTVNSSGWTYVGSGYRVTDAEILENGTLEIDGGSVYGTTAVSKGGTLIFAEGSVLNGTVTVSGNMEVNGLVNAAGSELNLDISGRTESDSYLVNSLAGLTGAGYAITVSETQSMGTYKLVEDITGFTENFTIRNTAGVVLGTLSVGNRISLNDMTLYLNNTSNSLSLRISADAGTVVTQTGKFSTVGGAVRIDDHGTVRLHDANGSADIGNLNMTKWDLLDSGDFNRDGKDGLLWLEKATGNVYMQNDLSNMAEVNNKSNLLGIAGDGYEVQAAGDFFGTGFDGALLLGPAFGNSSVSLNYGLATWTREQDGSTTPGWLGALVNTWEESGPLNSLKGDFRSLTGDARNEVINKNNYQYEFVGVGDFNGDGRDDVMLRNTMPDIVDGETITGAGDVFVFLTDTRENVIAGNRPAEGIVYTGCATDGWDVVGFGDFNGDGINDVVISNGTDLAGWQVSNGQRTEDLWFGSLTDGWKFAGVGDFDADGTDDILLADPDNNLAAWKIKDGQAAGVIAIA